MKSDSILEIGMVVKLRSGGPKMTINWKIMRSGGEGYDVDCHWMVKGELKSGRFHEAELMISRAGE